jgi:lysophospholipase L1-like esterase
MRLILSCIALVVPATLHAAEPFALKNGQRVVFLGDSNTYAGGFIAYLDAYLCTRFPDQKFELINLGLPSETVSGLSEPDHPYPRPNIHDRIDRALELSKPDVVVICYGMNDGIYYPFDAKRFEKYQDGIAKLVKKVEAAGAKVILMSPSPFDPKPLKDKVLAKGAEKYSWLKPYEKYDDEVLTKYSEWLLTWRKSNYIVVDAHAAVLKHLEAMRAMIPDYRVSGDGIHPDANGHLVIALEILKELNAPSVVKDIDINTLADPPTKSDVTIKSARRSSVSFSFELPLPMPIDPAWNPKTREVEKFDERVNRYSLKITGPAGFLAIREGLPKGPGKRTPITADVLAKGIDLADLLKLSTDKTTTDVLKRIQEKNRILGLAWLTHVGHKRPDTPKGMALDEAKKKTQTIDEEVRKLCKPTEVSLTVGPFGK